MTKRHSGQAVRTIEFAGGDGTRLAGTLTQPQGTAQFPAVVVAHAASGGTRGASLHRHLAAFLPSLGVATFIYDRRGEGASGGSPGATLNVLAEDVRAAVLMLAEQPDVRPGCIGLWGHSQGGWVAPLAAAGNDMVAFLIVVAGSGVTPDQQMIYATASLMREAGYSERQVAQATRLRSHLLELMGDRRSLDAARRLIEEASAEPWYALTYLPSASPRLESELQDEVSFEWDFDISPTLARLRIPVLAIHGETDRWVPIGPSLDIWRTALSQGPARLSVKRLPGSGHFPTLATDPADLDEAGPISPAYEQVLRDWFRTLL